MAREYTPIVIKKRSFGKISNGQEIVEYTLTNGKGISVSVINYGGIITSLITPDREGMPGDIVLGFDNINGYVSDEYITNRPYFGAIIGRYANRIAGGKFTLDGKEHILATNSGGNHIHGGIMGFDKVIWNVQESKTHNQMSLKLSYHSKDGEEGYPGNLMVHVTYSLTETNKFRIDYKAETDKATPITLTNHTYFNLEAGQTVNALGHIIKINADKYLVMNEQFIPTGELRSVERTPLNFKEPQQLLSLMKYMEGTGYAHTYVLNKIDKTLCSAATVYAPVTGRKMEVYTTEPGLIFYTGNFLNGRLAGKEGRIYPQFYGFALETQHFPDSPNHPQFPCTILRQGETYTSSTVFEFSTWNNNKDSAKCDGSTSSSSYLLIIGYNLH